MNTINPFLLTDGYKTSHHKMYPEGTEYIYSNFTPRHGKHSNTDLGGVISFGQQMIMQQIHNLFKENFFKRDRVDELESVSTHDVPYIDRKLAKDIVKEEVINEIKKEYSLYLGNDYNVSHIEKLWDLGYLPIKVKSLTEGTFVPYGVPVLTIINTKPEFYWLTNFLETLISNLLWKPMTSATTAYAFKKLLVKAALETDKNNIDFVDFQGHDFSMRGLSGIDDTIASGLGHATSFKGSDSIPVIYGARNYYDEKEFVIGSVPASEHSVMSAGGNESEIETFKHLMKQYPTGILSIVSDTWDLWKVLTEYLPELKDEIMKRDGKIVIRPDSGNPVDIICGIKLWDITNTLGDLNLKQAVEEGYKYVLENEAVYKIEEDDFGDVYYYINRDNDYRAKDEVLGVIELLWDEFGGTINEQGYKVLDLHIGAIYGDSISLERAKQITERLKAKGFASTNIVLGIGSYTYEYVTRDTHGFAMKATWAQVKGESKNIFKDPITDDGHKKSAKGLLSVIKDKNGAYQLIDEVMKEAEEVGELKLIYENGQFYNSTTLTEIRERINKI